MQHEAYLPGLAPAEQRDVDDGPPGALEQARAVLRRLAVEQPQSLRSLAAERVRARHAELRVLQGRLA